MTKPITTNQLSDFKKDFLSLKQNQIAQTAATTNGLFKASENIQSIEDNHFSFSIDVDKHPVTNQRMSGRCWMYSCLNVVRFHIEQKYNITNFELSENYLFFWDKLEKSNYFYQNIVDTANKDVFDREVQFLLSAPQQDGGDWALALSLIKKYGIVPKYEMEETSCTKNSSEINTLLNRKLRADAVAIREMIASGETMVAVQAYIDEQLIVVYRILSIAFGTPPETIDFTFTDKNKKYTTYQRITPNDFYQKYSGFDSDDYAVIYNAPVKEAPFGQPFKIELSGNMVDGETDTYLNLEIDELRKLTIDQLKLGEPVWFACDVLKHFDRLKGIMSDDLYKFDALFDTEVKLTKGDRINYLQSGPDHAMVFAGVNLVKDEPTKWKVENSWGEKIGAKGYCVMDDAWFSDYVFEVIIRKELLNEEQLTNLKKEPIVFPFYSPY